MPPGKKPPTNSGQKYKPPPKIPVAGTGPSVSPITQSKPVKVRIGSRLRKWLSYFKNKKAAKKNMMEQIAEKRRRDANEKARRHEAMARKAEKLSYFVEACAKKNKNPYTEFKKHFPGMKEEYYSLEVVQRDEAKSIRGRFSETEFYAKLIMRDVFGMKVEW